MSDANTLAEQMMNAPGAPTFENALEKRRATAQLAKALEGSAPVRALPPHTDAILAIARPLRRVAETYVQHDPTCPAARAWHELALACDMLEQIATQIADYLDDPPRKP